MQRAPVLQLLSSSSSSSLLLLLLLARQSFSSSPRAVRVAPANFRPTSGRSRAASRTTNSFPSPDLAAGSGPIASLAAPGPGRTMAPSGRRPVCGQTTLRQPDGAPNWIQFRAWPRLPAVQMASADRLGRPSLIWPLLSPARFGRRQPSGVKQWAKNLKPGTAAEAAKNLH